MGMKKPNMGFPGKARQEKAKMCNGRRHVPLCPACANEKLAVQVQLYYKVIIRIYPTFVPDPG